MKPTSSPTEPFLTKSKLEFVRTVGLQRYVLGTILVPAKMYSAVELLFQFLSNSGISFNTYLQVIGGFGFTILYDLIADCKIRSYFELLKIMKFIRKNLNEFVDLKDKNTPLYKTENLSRLFSDFNKRNMSKDKIKSFLKFQEDVLYKTQDRIIMSDEMYDAIWKVWDERNNHG